MFIKVFFHLMFVINIYLVNNTRRKIVLIIDIMLSGVFLLLFFFSNFNVIIHVGVVYSAVLTHGHIGQFPGGPRASETHANIYM